MSENGSDHWMDEAVRSSHRRGYHRPSDAWECGVSSKDCRCATGPTIDGKCPSSACRPVHRLHWWRRRSRSVITVLGICICSIILATPWHREFLAPGELSKAHSQILHGPLQENRCAVCHPAGQLSTLAWLAAPHPSLGTNTDQKSLCIQCHQIDMPDLALSSPHDLTRQQILALQQPTSSQRGPAKFVSHNQGINWESHDLACSDCHREHQGPGFDLTSISSQRCQACHQQQFNNFANAHPEFDQYPYQRERRLVFDHTAHRDKHFAKEGQSFDCRKCHVDSNSVSAVGQVFRTVSYENSCASCHDKSMKSSLADGVLVFQLPSLDKRKLESIGQPLANWPEEAGQMMDGRIPPIMAMLMFGDTEGREALEALPASGLLSDLKFDDAEDLQAILKLARSSQRLLRELAEKGQESLQSRIASCFQALPNAPSANIDRSNDVASESEKLVSQVDGQGELSAALRSKLSEGMPPDLFRSAYREWFPSETMGANSTTTITQPKRRPFQTIALSPPAEKDSTNDDLLSDRSNGQANSDNDLLGGALPLSNAKLEDSKMGDPDWSRNPIKSTKHLPTGGWFVDTTRMAIVYIPTGHADPWLTAWKQFAASSASHGLSQSSASVANEGNAESMPWDQPKRPPRMGKVALEHIMTEMLAPKSNGACMECHSSEQIGRAEIVQSSNEPWGDHWKAKERPPKLRQLTRFDHTPHLILPSLQDCTACHHSTNSTRNGQGDFMPMTKNDCAQCHRENAAGESCTQCHSYHIGREGWEWDHAWTTSRIAEALRAFQR